MSFSSAPPQVDGSSISRTVGNKIQLESVNSKTCIAAGTVAHNGTIAAPTGFTLGVNAFAIVSINHIGTPSGGDGDNLEELICSVNQNTGVVTCKAWIRTNVAYVTGTANYLIFGFK